MKHLADNEIQSYLQDLPVKDRARIKYHLNECPDCKKKLILYKKFRDLVVSVSSNPIPEDFEIAIMGRIRSIRRLSRIIDVIVATVAFIGLALLGSIVFLTPLSKDIVTKALTEALQYGSELSTANGAADATTILVFGIILLVLFATIDRWTTGRLKLAGKHGKCPETR